VTETSVARACPQCHLQVTSFRGARWCPRCEWNLDRYDPERHGRPFGWAIVDRWAHRTAYRWQQRQYAALAGRDLAARRLSATRLVLGAISLLLGACGLAILAAGVLLITYDFPRLTIVPGILLVLVGLTLRPRFGRVDPLLEALTRDQAPALFRLIDRVAERLGAPAPHVVGMDRAYNATAGAVGLRRRRVLTLGLPLWAALPPQQRVALLCHEFGHFTNGDVRRGLLTQPAFVTLGTLATLTRPDPDELDRASGVTWLGLLLCHLVMSVVSRFFWSLHLAVVWLALRDGQRAEYLADVRTVAIAGSAGTRGLIDTLVTLDAIAVNVARAARAGGDVAAWRAAAGQARQEVAEDLPLRHQLSISDETSLFASHPPAGLRRRMVDAQPWQDPAVVLTEQESDRIDAELARAYARARRDVGALA
jgi:Zn-dependent protease with chaperone function